MDTKHTYSLLLYPQQGRPCNKRHSISFKSKLHHLLLIPCLTVSCGASVSAVHLLYLAMWICKHPCEDLAKSLQLHSAAVNERHTGSKWGRAGFTKNASYAPHVQKVKHTDISPTSVFFGSWGDSAGPAGPPSSLTNWSWHSGSGSPPRPLSGAGSGGCLRSLSCTSAQSRHWTHRCWHRRQNTSLVIHTSASMAFSVGERKNVKVV